MRELPDRYVFDTLLDGRVLLHKENYRRHARIHPIGRPEDLQVIQRALVDPDIITAHDRPFSGRQFHHRTYYRMELTFVPRMRRAYPKYWKVVIRDIGRRRRQWCVVTAFWDDQPLNKPTENLIYKKSYN